MQSTIKRKKAKLEKSKSRERYFIDELADLDALPEYSDDWDDASDENNVSMLQATNKLTQSQKLTKKEK